MAVLHYYTNYVETAHLIATTVNILCRTVAFKNQGTSDVLIEGVVILAPGENYSVGGNDNYKVKDSFTIAFTGAGTNNCLVVEEFYAKELVT